MNKEYTLQDCINQFNIYRCEGSGMEYISIKKMERLSEWRVASEYWKKIGRQSDADACTMLADAIAKGDAFREETKPFHDWVDKTVEEGILTKEEASEIVYPEIRRIYNKHK